MPAPFIQEYQAGREIQAGQWTLVPFSKRRRLTIPGRNWGFVWNRPASLLVRGADVGEEVIPIPDLTMRVICSLFAVALGAVALAWIIARWRWRSGGN